MTKADAINQIIEICCQKNTPEEKEFIRRALFVINEIKYEEPLDKPPKACYNDSTK